MCTCNWISPLFVFVYSSVAVFIIVGGQSTTGNDDNYDDQLANTVAMLQSELAKLAARNEKLEVDYAELAKSVNKTSQLEATTLDNRKYCFSTKSLHQ